MTKTFKTSSFFYIVDFCFKIMILVFFLSTGESWGHASTIRIVLYWEDNQRYEGLLVC